MADEPLEELKRLAAAGGDRVRNREVEKQYVELAINRDYSQGDTATGPKDIYTFLESLGGKLVPHGSQGPPVYSGGEALDSGHFFAHLSGNEQCVRDWQSSDGPSFIQTRCASRRFPTLCVRATSICRCVWLMAPV